VGVGGVGGEERRQGRAVEVGADCDCRGGGGEDEDDTAEGAERGEGVDWFGGVALKDCADCGEGFWCEDFGVVEVLEGGEMS